MASVRLPTRPKSITKRQLIVACLGLIPLIAVAHWVRHPHFATFRDSSKDSLPPWSEGLLDIHHLRVGSSVCTFCIFPDGTTLLIDAGDRNVSAFDAAEAKIIQDAYPTNEKAVVEWILEYLHYFWPKLEAVDDAQRQLDYALITHFHSDHIGTVTPGEWPSSKSGKFKKSGITWVAEELSIGTLIDRNFPNYNFPVDLRTYSKNHRNYLSFVEEYTDKIKFERFQVGSYKQIRPVHTSTKTQTYTNLFQVRNIKSNLEFSPALPDNSYIFSIPNPERLVVDGKWNENKLSTAVVIEYGNYRYYNGADQEHRDFEGSPRIDTVTPVAMAVGKVNIATLNHHGYGTNDAYFRYLNPDVLVLPSWHLRHPPSFLSSTWKQFSPGRSWFSTYTHPENEVRANGDIDWNSTEGHTVVRVYPRDETTRQQAYEIFVLDGERQVVSTHGPFEAKN